MENGEISWCAADMLRKQNPFIFVPYIINQKLVNHNHFKWAKAYLHQNKAAEQIVKINKVQHNSKMPKFKFGVQVPDNPTHAMKLDNINGDGLWMNSIEKEKGSMGKYKCS